MNKQQKIELLMKFIKGEIPVERLKQHKVTFFMYMTPDQLTAIEDITGPVEYYRSNYMPDGERIAGLFDGVPVGFTAIWHLSMLWHPDSASNLIVGNRPDNYNQFISDLRKDYEKPKMKWRKWISSKE